MSGPREPWRSKALSKRAVARISRRWGARLHAQTVGARVGRLRDRELLLSLDPIEPRETRDRDRSLSGKARRRARKAGAS